MREITTRRRVLPKKLLVGALIASLASVLAACGTNPAISEQTSNDSGNKTVRVTVTPGVGSLPLRIAEEKGFFADRGITLEVTEGFDYTSYVTALGSQFDAVMLISSDMISKKAAGVDFKAYAGMQAITEESTTNPMITNAAGVESLADLANKGGTLGVIRVADETKAALAYSLKGTGADAANLKLVAVPFPNMADQLKAGRIDAAIVADGFYEPLLKEGYRVIWQMPKTAVAKAGAKFPLSWAQFVSTSSYVEKNPKTVDDFQAAIKEAATWIHANKEDALHIYADWIGAKYEVVANSTIPPYKAEFTASDVVPWLPILEEGGLMKKPIDPKSLLIKASGGN